MTPMKNTGTGDDMAGAANRLRVLETPRRLCRRRVRVSVRIWKLCCCD